MKTLVSGLSGFVGAHLSKVCDCVDLGDPTTGVDLRDPASICGVVEDVKPDAVVHLAAQSFVPRSFEDPQETFDINFQGTFNLLQALKATGFTGRFLYIGSGDMYGLVDEEQLPIQETTPLRPRNPYAVSKVAAEALCYQWSQTEAFDVIMTRPFNQIGPGQDALFVVASFAQQVAAIKAGEQEAIIEVGDIDVTRDFSDVRDVVEAYKLLLEKGQNGEVYNVCSGKERSVRCILEALMYLHDVDAEVKTASDRLRRSEQRRVCGANDKLRKDTGWERRITLENSLKDILSYWENKLCVAAH